MNDFKAKSVVLSDIDMDKDEETYFARSLSVAVVGGFFKINYDKKPLHNYALISCVNGVVELYATFSGIDRAKIIVTRIRTDHPNTKDFSLYVVKTNEIMNISSCDLDNRKMDQ